MSKQSSSIQKAVGKEVTVDEPNQIKLLIVEDDLDQRELLAETLESHFGAGSVTGVGSAKAALAQDLRSFDLILADYNLPDANGIELLSQIHQSCSTPVILVTGENVGHIAAEAIQRGAHDYVVKIGDYIFTIPLVVEKNLSFAKVQRENEHLREKLELALRDVREKNAQLEASLLRVEQMAATDPLTGLYNRRHFGKVLDQLFAEAHRYDKDLACVMVDLDGYKQLNDTFGHQFGDQLLVAAGKVISANMRRMDVAARYGGDEFVLLLPHASSQEAAGVAERIREEFRASSASLLNRDRGISMSVGIGSIKSNAPTHADQLVARADAALYQAKEAGRDRIMLASPITHAEPPTPQCASLVH